MIHSFFFFTDTATTEIYTLSLHDALPICPAPGPHSPQVPGDRPEGGPAGALHFRCVRADGVGGDARGHAAARTHRKWSADRKSTRLNSSHVRISYAVFCSNKKRCDRSHER